MLRALSVPRRLRVSVFTSPAMSKSKLRRHGFRQRGLNQAYELAKKHLAQLREVADVKTICMHGSPLSKYDNRDLWNHYDYRDFGIIAEPYFDLDFSKVLYLTDTGRRWDGEEVSIRDKAPVRE